MIMSGNMNIKIYSSAFLNAWITGTYLTSNTHKQPAEQKMKNNVKLFFKLKFLNGI